MARWSLGLGLLGAWPTDLAGQQAAPDFARLVAEGDSAWSRRSYPVAQNAYARALALDSLGRIHVPQRNDVAKLVEGNR